MRGRVLLIALLSGACGPQPDGASATDSVGDLSGETGDSVDRGAPHEDAYARLLLLAQRSFAVDNPVAASQIGYPLEGPRIGLVARRAREDSFTPAWKEAGGIDATHLALQDQNILRAVRFALNREHDELTRIPIVRRDAHEFARRAQVFFDELEYRLVRGDCDECVTALGHLTSGLSAPRTLSQSSAAGLHAALEDFALIRERLEHLRPLVSGAHTDATTEEAIESLITKLDARVARHREQLEALGSAEPASWDEPPPLLQGRQELGRLPDSMGTKAFSRMLLVEESVDRSPAELIEEAKRNLARLGAMGKSAPPAAKTKATPVTQARCETHYARLQEASKRLPEHLGPELDCAAFSAVHADRKLDDAELVLALTDMGLIEPHRRTMRTRKVAALALVASDATPVSHLHVRRIMLTTALRETGAQRLALDAAKAEVCRTAANLWFHGTDDPEAATAWLASACPDRKAEAWLAEVAGRPRQALGGLGLATLGWERHEVVGIDHFWWVPIGLTQMLALRPGQPPGGSSAPPAGGPAYPTKAEVEDLNE